MLKFRKKLFMIPLFLLFTNGIIASNDDKSKLKIIRYESSVLEFMIEIKLEKVFRDLHMYVFDASGKLVSQQHHKWSFGFTLFKFNFKNGEYKILLFADDQIFSDKLLILK